MLFEFLLFVFGGDSNTKYIILCEFFFGQNDIRNRALFSLQKNTVGINRWSLDLFWFHIL